MRNIFWNQEQQRIRAAWRTLILILIYLGVTLVPRLLYRSATGVDFIASKAPITEVIRLAGLLIVLYLVAKHVDKRHFSDYGLNINTKTWWVNLLFGTLLGGLLIALVFLVQYFAEWLRIIRTIFEATDVAVISFLAVPVIGLVAAAFYIELAFTGYLLTNLSEGMAFLRRINKRAPVLAAWAVATGLVLIARVDLTSPEINLVLVFNLIRAAFITSLAFILTRDLGISVGLSIGWNIMSNLLFGWKIIGATVTTFSVITIVQVGPETLTGGDLGPEAGLLGMGAMILGGAIVILWTRRPHTQYKKNIDPWVFDYEPLTKSPVTPDEASLNTPA